MTEPTEKEKEEARRRYAEARDRLFAALEEMVVATNRACNEFQRFNVEARLWIAAAERKKEEDSG
jgi:hypothetical protein